MSRALAEGIAEQAPAESGSRDLAERIVEIGREMKAFDIRALRVLELVHYTDWFVIMSARSDRHVSAIRDRIEEEIRGVDGVRVLSVEGTERNQWVVLDVGDVIVHLFYEPVRDYYELDRLWAEAEELPLDDADAEPLR